MLKKEQILASGTRKINLIQNVFFENESDFLTKFCLQGYSICHDLKMHNFNWKTRNTDQENNFCSVQSALGHMSSLSLHSPSV